MNFFLCKSSLRHFKTNMQMKKYLCIVLKAKVDPLGMFWHGGSVKWIMNTPVSLSWKEQLFVLKPSSLLVVSGKTCFCKTGLWKILSFLWHWSYYKHWHSRFIAYNSRKLSGDSRKVLFPAKFRNLSHCCSSTECSTLRTKLWRVL